MPQTPNSVRLVGWYGGDLTHAQAAWTSTDTDLQERIAEKPHSVESLLKMLAIGSDGHPHATPFERSLLHFNVTVDTATHIHILKHRTIAANGESARYKELTQDRYHIPSDWPAYEQQCLKEHLEESYRKYHEALERLEPIVGRKRAKESARFYLPYGVQITLDISMNFRAFVAFQGLRGGKGAQKEVRDLADQMLLAVHDQTNDDFKFSLAAFDL